MANNLKLSNATVDVQGDATAPLFNNGYLRIYEGTPPATADTEISGQVLLAEPRFASTGIATNVNGLLTANALTADSSAMATATTGASFYRSLQSDGVTVIAQGLVGVTGSGSDCELNSVMIQAGAEVGVTSFTHTIPKG